MTASRQRTAWLLVIALAAGGLLLLRACYGLYVNEDDQPAAERIVAALEAYRTAHGRYPATLQALVPRQLPSLPAPRDFGRIGYAALDGGTNCRIGYFTHRDFLKEYECATRQWRSLEYDESRLVKERGVQWIEGNRP